MAMSRSFGDECSKFSYYDFSKSFLGMKKWQRWVDLRTTLKQRELKSG